MTTPIPQPTVAPGQIWQDLSYGLTYSCRRFVLVQEVHPNVQHYPNRVTIITCDKNGEPRPRARPTAAQQKRFLKSYTGQKSGYRFIKDREKVE
jgi:hypothetical protein